MAKDTTNGGRRPVARLDLGTFRPSSLRESAYGLTGLPETHFLDRQGRVISHWVGEISEAELEAGMAATIEGRTERE